MKTEKVEVKKDKNDRYRGKVTAANGNVLVVTSESDGYTHKEDAENALKKSAIAIIKALFVFLALSMPAFGQGNDKFKDGLNMIGDAVASSTNWTVVAGYGRCLNGNKNLAFGALAYSLSDNVGLVAGYDYLWNSRIDEANFVKGGFTLRATIHPFAFIGSTPLTNVLATPFVTECLGTPKGGSDVSSITTAGVNFNVIGFKNFMLDAGVQYENRTGSANWNGNYVLGHLGISRVF